MVFIRPIIIRTPQKAIEVADDKYTQLRDKQIEFLNQEHYNKHFNEHVLPNQKKRHYLPPPYLRQPPANLS